jgi:hypothetical protein
MVRTLVVRRLTAVLVLLAIFCLSLPATAAPAAHHALRAPVAQAPGLFDQLLSWLGGFLPGHAPASPNRTEKTISTGASTGGSGTIPLLPLSNDADRGGMIDPNG